MAYANKVVQIGVDMPHSTSNAISGEIETEFFLKASRNNVVYISVFHVIVQFALLGLRFTSNASCICKWFLIAATLMIGIVVLITLSFKVREYTHLLLERDEEKMGSKHVYLRSMRFRYWWLASCGMGLMIIFAIWCFVSGEFPSCY